MKNIELEMEDYLSSISLSAKRRVITKTLYDGFSSYTHRVPSFRLQMTECNETCFTLDSTKNTNILGRNVFDDFAETRHMFSANHFPYNYDECFPILFLNIHSVVDVITGVIQKPRTISIAPHPYVHFVNKDSSYQALGLSTPPIESCMLESLTRQFVVKSAGKSGFNKTRLGNITGPDLTNFHVLLNTHNAVSYFGGKKKCEEFFFTLTNSMTNNSRGYIHNFNHSSGISLNKYRKNLIQESKSDVFFQNDFIDTKLVWITDEHAFAKKKNVRACMTLYNEMTENQLHTLYDQFRETEKIPTYSFTNRALVGIAMSRLLSKKAYSYFLEQYVIPSYLADCQFRYEKLEHIRKYMF